MVSAPCSRLLLMRADAGRGRAGAGLKLPPEQGALLRGRPVCPRLVPSGVGEEPAWVALPPQTTDLKDPDP